ncbi:DMT family transporter [Cytobacillus firmus]|uniref:DMT family transporter n=1 Tax=Cytobacillus firmus TaxID=1399 RepID=UPI0029D40EB0|nr:DMT family transporter [Cytobacillus firmus]
MVTQIFLATNFATQLRFLNSCLFPSWGSNIPLSSSFKYVDASKASILSNLEPFVAMLMGLILLYKPITGFEILGSVLIVGGVLISTYQRKGMVRHNR